MKFKRSCLILLAMLSLASTCGTASAKQKLYPLYSNPVRTNKVKQYKHQNNKKMIKTVKKQAKKSPYYKLNKKQLKARNSIAYMESRYDWNASNGRCFGRYQLLPSYLGYTHGHINMDHRHQVQVADHYVRSRYGTWTNALHFHLEHGWY